MPRAATAAARAKLRALASTYDPDSSDSEKSDDYAAASGGSAPSSVVSDDGSSSDFDPPSEDDIKPRKGTPKQTPRRAGGVRGVPGGTKAKITEGTLGGRNSLGLSAAELRILNSAGGNVSRTPGKGPTGTGRVGVFPSGGPTPFISTLVWDDEDMDVDCGEGGEGGEGGKGAGGEDEAAAVGWQDPRRAQVNVEPAPARDARRERFRDLARRVGVLSPPENWEGEGWLPEMYRARAAGESDAADGTAAAKATTEDDEEGEPIREGEGEGLPAGWIWRQEVKLDVQIPKQQAISEEEG